MCHILTQMYTGFSDYSRHGFMSSTNVQNIQNAHEFISCTFVLLINNRIMIIQLCYFLSDCYTSEDVNNVFP